MTEREDHYQSIICKQRSQEGGDNCGLCSWCLEVIEQDDKRHPQEEPPEEWFKTKPMLQFPEGTPVDFDDPMPTDEDADA